MFFDASTILSFLFAVGSEYSFHFDVRYVVTTRTHVSCERWCVVTFYISEVGTSPLCGANRSI